MAERGRLQRAIKSSAREVFSGARAMNKIEKAATDYADLMSFQSEGHHRGFQAGARWMREEIAKSYKVTIRPTSPNSTISLSETIREFGEEQISELDKAEGKPESNQLDGSLSGAMDVAPNPSKSGRFDAEHERWEKLGQGVML